MNDATLPPFVILIVDDNPDNRFTLRALLKGLGDDCRLVEADSGAAALARVLEEEVHLILLDVQMPGMDGFETARHLQLTERTRTIPIVFITAVFKTEEFFRRGFVLGAIDYLTKPIDDNLLLNRVRLYRNLHRREQQLSAAVTQLRERERALIEARAAAEAANRAKSQFLANMSHELRTPLNAILGFAQIMARDPMLPEHARKNLEIIDRSGRHLLALINDVLEIARIEAGHVRMEREAFDFESTLRTVEDMIRPRAEAKGLVLHVERAHALPRWVVGDAHHLRQVLLNLLGNAVKYTDRGRVCLRLTPIDGHIRFDVEDTGSGIDPAEQTHIFDAFYQSESGIAKGEGAGLGLALSRQYVRLMGGEIELASTPGAGSRFTFTLPLPRTDAPVRGENPVPPLAMTLAPEAGEVRILIAEDHPENRRMLQELLEQAGFHTQTANDGEQAVERFQSFSPHLVLMDMRMPVFDGYAATRRIRALPGGEKLPILAVTASAFAEEQAQILAAGCTGVMTKPIDANALLERIGRLLNVRYQTAHPPESSPSVVDFRALAPDLRAELIDAAIRLDIQHTRAIAERLRPRYPREAAALDALLADYQFERILALCAHETDAAATPPAA